MSLEKIPESRREDVVIQELKDELLIYDLKINKVFCLNETSAMVWQLCDGKRSISEISREMSRRLKAVVSEDFVLLALDGLEKDKLLASGGGETRIDFFGGLSRRQMIKKVGLASMIALPVISSLVAPTAAHAQSGVVGLGANCTSATCASGLSCTNQFGATVCRASPGGTCSLARPDLCTSGCCTSIGAPPGSAICC